MALSFQANRVTHSVAAVATQCYRDLITYESGDCIYGAALGVLELIANFVVPERPSESARVCTLP